MTGICGSLAILSLFAAWRFLSLPLDDPMRRIGGFMAATVPFSAMFFVFGLLMPQRLLRMTPRKIQYARRWFIDKRIEMRWDEIERVRCGNGTAREVRTGRSSIFLMARELHAGLLLRAEAASHLSRFFDLSTPTPFDLRMQAHQNRTWRKRIGDWMLLVAVGLAFAALFMAACIWSQDAGPHRSLRTMAPFAIFLSGWALIMRKMIREARGQWKVRKKA